MPVIEGFTERAARGAGGAIEGFQPRITGELRPPTGSRSALGFANDTIVTGVNSALGIGKAISDFVSVDNPVSRGLQWLIDEGEQTYTPQTRASREELFRSIDEGGWDAARGVGEFVLTSPVQAAAMAAGNFGPFGAGIKGARGLAAAAGAGTRGVRAAGMGAMSAMGGAAAGGDAAGDAYEQVMRSPNVDPAVREELARQAAREASAVPAVIGALTPFLPGSAESQLARGLGITRASIPRAAASEFGQEFIEEGATKLSANLAAQQYDPAIDASRGVLGSALLGGVLGAGTGATVAYINNRGVQADLLRRDAAIEAQLREREAQLAPILGRIRPDSGVGTQDLINQQLGISPALSDKELARQRKQREADILAAFNEPTKVRAVGEDGQERELTAIEATLRRQGLPTAPIAETPAPAAPPSKVFSAEEQELIGMGVTPTPAKRALWAEAKAAGLTQNELDSVGNELGKNYGEGKKALQAILVARNKPAAAAAPTVAPTPAGGLRVAVTPDASSPLVPPNLRLPTAEQIAADQQANPQAWGPSLQQPTPAAPTPSVAEAPGVTSLPVPEVAPDVQAPQAVQGEAPAEAAVAAPATQDAAPAAATEPVTATTPAAPTEPVVQRKARRVVDPAALRQAQAFVAPEPTEEQAAPADPNVTAWEDSKPDDAPALTALTPSLQQVWAQAVAAKGEGRRINLFKVAEDILAEQGEEFTGDDTLETLNQIFGERDAAMLYDRYVDNMTEEAIANKYGQSRQNVHKITGEGKLGQKTRADKIEAAKKKFGWTDDFVDGLLDKFASPEVIVEDTDSETDSDAATEGRTNLALEATEVAFGAGQQQAEDPSMKDAGFGTATSIGGAQGNWKDTLKAGDKALSEEDQEKLGALNAQIEALDEALEQVDDADNADDVGALRQERDELLAKVSGIEANKLGPQELASRYAQLSMDLREKALKRRQQIEQARAAGKDTVSVNNKLVPVAELEAQEAELEQKAQEALEKAEAVLQRGAVRKAKGAEPKTDKPKVRRVKKDEAKAPTAPAVEQTTILTTVEQAARAWDQATNTIPGAPKWADLTPAQQREFVGYGEGNWTRQDVVTMLQRAAPAPAAQDRDARDSANSTSQRERDLRAKSRDKEQPGDVMLATTGKFVSFEDALEAARAAVASGALRPDAPFQYNAVLDIAPRDWNRMVQAMTKPAAPSNSKFGKAGAVKGGYTAAELIDDIKAFIRADVLGRKLVVVDTIGDLTNSTLPEQRAVGAEIFLEGAYGVASNGVAYLVADRIRKGTGRAKFMHEVGGHLGLEQLLSKALFDKLVDQIKVFGRRDGNPIEKQLALEAAARVAKANPHPDVRRAELVAYFLEVAVERGINPTADVTQGSSGLQAWFRTLWAAFKVAVRRLGFKSEKMSPQDIVNLAFGAARLEITGTWHGTAGEVKSLDGKRVYPFRRLLNKYIGTGEGAQVYGWGQYIAQAVKTGGSYFAQDVRRKTAAMPVAIKYQGMTAQEWADRAKTLEDQAVAVAIDMVDARFAQGKGGYASPETALHDLIQSTADDIQMLKRKIDEYTPEVLKFMDLLHNYRNYLVAQDVRDPLNDDVFYQDDPIDADTALKLAKNGFDEIELRNPETNSRVVVSFPKKQRGFLPKSPWHLRALKKIEVLKDTVNTAEVNLSNLKSLDGRLLTKQKEKPPEGSLMRVDTFVRPEELMVWDEPLSKQPPEVRDVLSRVLGAPGSDTSGRPIKFRDSDSVAKLYKQMSSHMTTLDLVEDGAGGFQWEEKDSSDFLYVPTTLMIDGQLEEYLGNPEAVSRWLDSMGVKGVTHTDRDSRIKSYHTYPKRGALDSVFANLSADVKTNFNFRAAVDLAQDVSDFVDGGKDVERIVRNIGLTGAAADAVYEYADWLQNKTGNIIVFDDKNVFRVGALVAADKERIRFGKDLSEQLPEPLKKPVGTITTVLNDTKNLGLNLLTFTEDVMNRAIDLGVESAGRLRTIYQERAALTGKLEREVERVADLYNRVPERERGTGPQSVNQFLYDATREGKWGFKPSWRRGPSAAVTLDPDMLRRYGALSKESKALVEAVFRHGDEVLSLKKQTVIDATNSEYDALIAAANKAGDSKKAARLTADKADQLKRFKSLFELQEFKPYAPLRRFGKYVVIAKSQKYLDADEKAQRQLEKSEDHYHVSFAESASAARELVEQLNKQGAFAEVVFREKEAVQQTMFGGTLTAFNKLRSELDSELADAAPGEKAAIRAARKVVGELYLSTLAENSARKSEMRRRGVAGEIDVLRSFTTQGRADARFIAGAKYNGQTLDTFNAMRKEVKKGGAEEQNTKSGVFNELMKRHTQSLDYDPTPIASKLARLSTIWYLATSPAYYLQNLTQPFMLSLPVMAGKYNYLKVGNALVKAYTDLGPMFRNAKLGEQFNYNAAPADVRAAISTLVDRGRIDIGMDTDLGDFQLEGKGPVKDRWNKIDRAIRNGAQKLEAVNRLSTAIAAYRLELAETGDAAKALDYAESIISQTHGDYTALNAPRAFNTATGKVALQFRKFQLIQLTLLTKLMDNSLPNKQDAAVARKALAFTLGHTAVMAGAIGLPGFAAIAWALGMMSGDDEEPFNAEKELREFIGNDQLATLLTRGAPAALGVDLSQKLGMGNVLSLLPFNDLDLSSRSGLESAAFATFGGPAGGLTLRAADGINLIRDGQYYRGLEQLVPTGLTNAMRAGREASEGVTRRNGDVLISPEEISGMETFWRAIGLPPTQMAERQFFDKVVRDTDQAFQKRADRIRNAYLRAGDDYDARAEARERWMELQDAREAAGYRRQPLSSLIRAEQRQDERERNTLGGVQFNRDNRSFVQELIAAEED